MIFLFFFLLLFFLLSLLCLSWISLLRGLPYSSLGRLYLADQGEIGLGSCLYHRYRDAFGLSKSRLSICVHDGDIPEHTECPYEGFLLSRIAHLTALFLGRGVFLKLYQFLYYLFFFGVMLFGLLVNVGEGGFVV